MNPSRSIASFGLVSLGLVSLPLASSLQAETLVQYNFTSSTVSAARTPAIIGANVTTAAFANGAGVSIQSSSTGIPDPRSFFVASSVVDEAISPASTDWLGFTISATGDNVLNLSNLSFYYGYTNTSGTISGSATFDVRSSVDNYASSVASYTLDVANSTTPNWALASIGLSALPYQGLDTISFRIFLADGANASTNSQLRLDTVTLSGVSAAAIPEPSTAAALVGLCGLGFAASRRRRAS